MKKLVLLVSIIFVVAAVNSAFAERRVGLTKFYAQLANANTEARQGFMVAMTSDVVQQKIAEAKKPKEGICSVELKTQGFNYFTPLFIIEDFHEEDRTKYSHCGPLENCMSFQIDFYCPTSGLAGNSFEVIYNFTTKTVGTTPIGVWTQ